MPPFETLWHALRHWADETPGRIALRQGERSVEYHVLAAKAEDYARFLRSSGVQGGDRVIIVGLNVIEWVVAYLAVMRLGAIAVPANNRISALQMTDLVNLLEARVAIADKRHTSLLAKAPILVLPLEMATAISAQEDLPDFVTGEAPALISFSSGTTGEPKGALLSTQALCMASEVFRLFFRATSADSTVVIAPMFHNTGFIDQFGQMLLAGGETMLVEEFHRKEAIAAFKAAPATFVTAVPSVLRMLMILDDADAVFGPARTVLFGGSPMPAAWSREMLERWPHLELVHGYGLTEFGCACSFLPPTMITDFGESVGFAAPFAELRVVGEDGRDVAQGESGEVWVAGPTRMTEYWRRPEANAEKLSGKWLRTGDLGRFDDAGRLFLDGRRDDVINRGGEKILPSHLECLLAELPEIGYCVVIGIPDPVLQEVPVAALEIRPGRTFDEDSARAFLAARLPAYAMPVHFILFDPFPRIASGKVDRRNVRDAVIAMLNDQGPNSGETDET